MTNWTELKRLAEEATSGDWEHISNHDIHIVANEEWELLELRVDQPNDSKDAAFIAAANPKTILALIAENERLRGDVRMLVRQHMPLQALEGMEGWSEVVEARKAVEQRDQLRAEVEARRRQVETLTEWYANGLNEIQSLRNLLSAAISLDHHAITDRTYHLRRDIDVALGRDKA